MLMGGNKWFRSDTYGYFMYEENINKVLKGTPRPENFSNSRELNLLSNKFFCWYDRLYYLIFLSFLIFH